MALSPATDLGNLAMLVSPRVGVIRTLSRVPRGVEEPPVAIIYRAVISHFDFRRGSLTERMASGKGATEREAAHGAIGEAIEHYCASHPDPAGMQRASYAALAPRALDPRACVLYAEDQYARAGFPYERFSEQATLTWVRACEQPHGGDVLVPASFVYLNYRGEQPQEYLCLTTSNGLAAGPGLAHAQLAGLYELVERDAFIITWMNRLQASRIDLMRLGGVAGSIRTHYERFGLEVYAIDLTTDIPIYVMMAIVVDRSGRGPAAVVGLGASLDPRAALTKALLEVCQVRAGETARYWREPSHQSLRSYTDVHTMEEHSAFFAQRERLGELDFLLALPPRQRIEELPDRSSGAIDTDLSRCVELVAAVGSRVLCVEVTTPDVASAGLRVVRMIATGLQPIHFGHGQERRGGRRLYEVPALLGQAPRATTMTDLNPCPHPLA